jgi:D-threo-aldose 1-dehydrogenase
MCIRDRGIGIVIGGAYNSGVLATGARDGAYYDYAPAPPEILDRTRRIEKVCNEYRVPLKAAALQFPCGHPAVVSNVPGTRSKARFEENMSLMSLPIPRDFWMELRRRGLILEEAPLPEEPAV